jgi:hypothetical protein
MCNFVASFLKFFVMNRAVKIIYLLVIVSVMSSSAQDRNTEKTQESTKAFIAVDMVSKYLWRGFDYGGVSVLPAFGVAVKGFSFTAFGGAGFDMEQTKTLGLAAQYKRNGLSAMITDFWYSDAYTPLGKFPSTYFEYSAHRTTHIYEASLDYDFKYVAVSWNTIFAGYDFYKSNEKRAYSTYVEVSAPFRVGSIDFKADLGIALWDGFYSNGFNVVNTGVKASKTFYVNEKLAIPVSTQIIVNPYSKQAYILAGVGFWL